MLNIIFDFLLVFIFFIIFKLYNIYIATAVLIGGAFFQLILTRVITGYFEKKQLIVFMLLSIFGGMTLYFHNPIFIKWKPTILFWLLGLTLLISQFISKKPLLQRIIGHALEGKFVIPPQLWQRLNIVWSIFFLLLGTVNIIIAYSLSTDAWVQFKLYGIFGALLLFSIAQSFFLAKYVTKTE